MSTHHTIVLSTQHDLTEDTWKDVFEEAGGSMNLAWDDFDPFEIKKATLDQRILFFWTNGGEMDHWAARLYEGLKKHDSSCEVEYFFDMTDEMHGHWKNGALRVEQYSDFYEIVSDEYTPLSNIVHNETEKFFSVVYGEEVLILTYETHHEVTSHNADFTELRRGLKFNCKSTEGQNVWIILYEDAFYSYDIEHGQL